MEEEYLEWLNIAESDLRTASYILSDKQILPAISVYHSHQCAEKCFKAVLVKAKINTPKIHNLGVLIEKALAVHPTLDALKEDCAVLNRFLPRLRYPAGDQITESDALYCHRLATNVYSLVIKLLKEDHV